MKRQNKQDFLIIGGGVVGLLLARELALSGAKVMVVERGECCREASWAGGGIVSPLYPWRYAQAVTALADWAQSFYPQLCASLLKDTGIDSQWQQSGLLMLEAADEAQALDWAAQTERPMQSVNTEFIYKHEPELASGYTRGLWMSEVANIRNPRLGQALVRYLQNLPNVTIHEHCELKTIESSGGEVNALQVSGKGQLEILTADNYIVSAGAWTGVLLQKMGVQLPVAPVKGQMLLYRQERRVLNSITLVAGRYLIPRVDGHILAGSTLEYCEFDKSTTAEALQSLHNSASAILPVLANCKPVQQWAGLRPAAPDGIPFIGSVSGFDNLFVNAGHFRNGLVLAPASARLLADLLLKRAPIVDPHPYQMSMH